MKAPSAHADPPSQQSVERRLPGAAIFAVLFGVLFAVPFGIRLGTVGQVGRSLPATYLPALEGPRERRPFDDTRIPELIRLNPGYVVIGDSMAGTRVDERRLGELVGRPVAPLLQAGSGPAFWYLALKNWVIASGIKPRAVLIFFRDTNLTDVLFRLDEQFRWSVDMVAREREPALDAVIASRLGGPRLRVHRTVEDLYRAEDARLRIEPAVTGWPARLLLSSRRRRTEFTGSMNARLGLDHQRRIEAADIQTGDDGLADFDRYIDQSVLPLMLRDARRAGFTLCLVRVQRRPVGGRPPEQSPAMRQYISRLSAYVVAQGGVWRDDTGDPELTLDMYEDGDHLERHARRRYTEILFDRLGPLFR